MPVLPDPRLAAQRLDDLYRRNLDKIGERDVLVASCGGAGQSLLGNILYELGLNYADAYTEVLHGTGEAVGARRGEAYRRHLASLHDKDNGGGARPVRLWPRFVKTHHPPVIFGDAGVLGVWLLVRDPRDALYSLYEWRHSFAEMEWDRVPDTFEAWLRGPGDFTGGPVEDWSAFHRAWQEHPRTTVIRFEDLKTDPEATLCRMLRPLDLDVSDAELRAAVEASTFERMRAHEDAVADTSARMIRSGRVNGWRSWMTPELAELFSGEELRTVAGRYGYDLSPGFDGS